MTVAIIEGVLCPVCQKETFQLFDREARLSPETTVMLKCCRRCANRIDFENEEEIRQKVLEGMTKAERRLARKEDSYRWAESLYGKSVVVYYDASDGRGGWEKTGCQVKGRAFRVSNVCGGWGCVSVLLDENEWSRLSVYRQDIWGIHGKKVVDVAIIDGVRWELDLHPYMDVKRDTRWEIPQNVHFYVSWGERGRFQVEAQEGPAMLPPKGWLVPELR